MKGREAQVVNKNNKNGNMILNNFLIEFECLINCLRNDEFPLLNTN